MTCVTDGDVSTSPHPPTGRTVSDERHRRVDELADKVESDLDGSFQSRLEAACSAAACTGRTAGARNRVPKVSMPSDRPVLESAVVEVPELEVLEDAVDGLPMRIDRLGAGPGQVRMTVSALPSMSISTGMTEIPIRSTGGVADGSMVVGLPLSPGVGSWNGVDLAPGRAWCHRPGAEHEGVAAKPPWWAAVTFEPDLLSADDRERLFPGGRAVEIFESAAAWRLSDLVRSADAALVGGLSPARAALLHTELVDAVAALGDGGLRLQTSTAARLVERCESVAPELGPIPTVRSLADAVGVSDRWVRAAFSQTYGVAPSAYYRARALARCRAELVTADPGGATVTDIAIRAGFWHLGRFSARYQEFFGERPSEALART